MNVVKVTMWRSLLRRIQVADRDVAAIMEAFLRERKPTRKLRMQRAAEVKAILKALDQDIKEEAPRIVSIAYDKSRRAALRHPNLSPFPEGSNFSNVHREAVALLTDNMVNSLGEATVTLGRRTDDAFRRHGLRTSAEQLANEQPTAVAAGRLARRLRDDGLAAFVDRAGRRWRLDTYANMVIKTTTSEAQSQAVINTMLSRSADLVTVEHEEHSHPDDECSEFEGRTFSLTGRTKGYPHLHRIPPFHPNCDHYLTPAKEGVEELLERRRREAEGLAA